MGEAKIYILHLFKISFIFPCFPQTSAPTATEAKMAGNTDRTFIMVKPDGVQRGLVGDIIKRFEQRGFKLVAMKFMQGSREHIKQHYIDLKDEPFYNKLVDFISSGPVVPMVWEGKNAAKAGRMMMGETDPQKSLPGSIRGDFCIDLGRNIIHGSDSQESAAKV